jgi:hypothetical protein
MMLAMILSFSSLSYSSKSRSAADYLQAAYEEGQIKDPIQALIALERFKSSSPLYQTILFLWFPLA